jgi:O-antigen/teichoic acid export membrane protein
LYPSLHLRSSLVNQASLRELVGFGIYRFIFIAGQQIIFYADSTIIALFMTTGVITYYAIAATLIGYGRSLVSLMTDSFYPLAVRLDAQHDVEGLRHLLIVGTKATLLLALPIGMGLIFLGEQFISLWVGQEYTLSAMILIILTLAQFSSMSQYISNLILFGMAKHKILAYLALGEALLNIVLSVIFIQRFGLVGVAWANVIPHLIVNTLIVPIYMLRQINLGIAEYVGKSILPPVICALPLAAGCLVFRATIRQRTWMVLSGEAIALAGVFYVFAYFTCLESQQKRYLRDKLSSLLKREVVLQ